MGNRNTLVEEDLTAGHRARPFPPNSPPARHIERTVINQESASIWAWPSRGGLIMLVNATPVDFDFLGLNPVHPPMRREPDQEAEDRFCQRLLLVGAKWFDSYERYSFINGLVADDERAILALEAGEEPVPTAMERRWIRVGHVAEGGFWVAEYETTLFGMQETDNLLPGDSGRVSIARTMDERCQIIQGMRGARFFTSLQEYDGRGCLNAWEEKTRGEFGPLVQTGYVDG